MFYSLIKSNIVCTETQDAEIILNCVDTQKLTDKAKLEYLSGKYNELNQVDLIKKYKDEYKNYRIISIYASLIQIVPSTQEEREKLIRLLSKNLDNDFVLNLYLDINMNLSHQEKLDIINNYIKKYGIYSNKDRINYNYIFMRKEFK